MRLKLLLGALIAGMGAIVIADDTAPTSDIDRDSSKSVVTSQPVVHSARLGEIDVNTPIYRSYTNAQISKDLNRIHKLSPQKRREILKEVSRRIERDGRFVVEENEQRFGQVVRPDGSEIASNEAEPVLEEIVIVPADAGLEDIDAVRTPEVRKSTRPPVRRVNSGRAYSPQQ